MLIKKISFALLILSLSFVAGYGYRNIITYRVPENVKKLKVSVKEYGEENEKIYILTVKPKTLITVRPIK